MEWHALDNKKQVKNNKPAKAFVKARKIYGDHMEDAPVNPVPSSEINTNFKQLMQLRYDKMKKRRRSDRLFFIFLLIAIALVIVITLFSMGEKFDRIPWV